MTYDEWFQGFCSRYYSGAFPNMRFGQAFSDQVYRKSPLLGGALTTFHDDPYYREENYISESIQDFLRRNWIGR